MSKKLISAILVFCVVLSLFFCLSGISAFAVDNTPAPQTAVTVAPVKGDLTAAESKNAATSGTCGENVTWAYDTATATLTISGTGAINNYDYSSYNGTYVTRAPWKSYYDVMKTVVINSGVTSIGECAFYGCTGLTSLTIPNSVTNICLLAFSGCTGLTSLTLPGNYISIGIAAFNDCNVKNLIITEGSTSVSKVNVICKSTLETVTIPDSVTSIDNSVFRNCTGLTSVTIGNGVTSIGDWAFEGCTGLTSITIPDGVTSLGWYMFSGCTGLTSVTIGNGVTSIGIGAFYDCTGLKSITIPDSVTNIGFYAFDGCTGLTNITIPESVTIIYDSAFDDCTGLKTVYYGGTQSNWNKIMISSYNDPLKNAKRYYNHYGHSWSYKYDDVVHWCECSICEEVAEATYHKFGKWTVTMKATETETGLQKHTCSVCGYEESEEIPVTAIKGDLNGDDEITDQDAIYLLFHTFFPEDYPIDADVDFDKDGEVTDQDAIYLLFYTFFPDDYPIS